MARRWVSATSGWLSAEALAECMIVSLDDVYETLITRITTPFDLASTQGTLPGLESIYDTDEWGCPKLISRHTEIQYRNQFSSVWYHLVYHLDNCCFRLLNLMVMKLSCRNSHNPFFCQIDTWRALTAICGDAIMAWWSQVMITGIVSGISTLKTSIFQKVNRFSHFLYRRDSVVLDTWTVLIYLKYCKCLTDAAYSSKFVLIPNINPGIINFTFRKSPNRLHYR